MTIVAIGATCKSLDKRMQQYQLRLYAIDVGLFEQNIVSKESNFEKLFTYSPTFSS